PARAGRGGRGRAPRDRLRIRIREHVRRSHGSRAVAQERHGERAPAAAASHLWHRTVLHGRRRHLPPSARPTRPPGIRDEPGRGREGDPDRSAARARRLSGLPAGKRRAVLAGAPRLCWIEPQILSARWPKDNHEDAKNTKKKISKANGEESRTRATR